MGPFLRLTRALSGQAGRNLAWRPPSGPRPAARTVGERLRSAAWTPAANHIESTMYMRRATLTMADTTPDARSTVFGRVSARGPSAASP